MSEIRVSEIRVSEIRISSNHRELHGAIFFLWANNALRSKRYKALLLPVGSQRRKPLLSSRVTRCPTGVEKSPRSGSHVLSSTCFNHLKLEGIPVFPRRVYIEGEYHEPDPRQLPPLPNSLTVGLQIALIQRERQIYYSKKKRRRRRRGIIWGTLLFVLIGALALILLDQAFGFFGL